LHVLVPLFKKGSVYLPSQYRGIHLTSIFAKTIERTIGLPLIAFLEKKGFGDNQWAFRKRSSAKDLVTISMAHWVLHICRGNKVGLYLSDISGAFDKVSRTLLVSKLSQLGLPDTFLDFINDYLLPREGKVAVEGALSDVMCLCDMVFQGTVLGPTLWNGFFADVAVHVPTGKQQVNLFADDLTGSTHVPARSSNALLMQELQEMQTRTHEWGARNQVTFDPSKEYFLIIHPKFASGNDFKMLGTLIDPKLSMQPCIEAILQKARPKIRAILRLRHIYSISGLIGQYKTHIWGISEYSNGAIILASASQLKRLDKMQRWFLYCLGITDVEAFLDYNFAPPSLRRRISLLGLLHKRTLGLCHPMLYTLLPPAQALAGQALHHDRPLLSYLSDVRENNRLYERSLWQYVLLYNRIPQRIVDLPQVATFQSMLIHLTKERAKQGDPTWRGAYQDCADILKLHRE